jgi:simple sugar transport system ATP-binding protein/ribose transport system ATP-binding protein
VARLIMATESRTTEPAHVELLDVAKQFGGVRALDGISLRIERGTIHALVGENGAGKSTLGKIVAGALSPDGGELQLGGEPLVLRSPREALDHGIASIAQEVAVVPRLSVEDNVLLGSEPRRGGFVRRATLRRRYQELAREAGFELPPGRPAGALRVAGQQQVEILRALSRDAQLIVMDEPAASLTGPDTEQLHRIIRALAERGRTVLLISHMLDEVLDLADTVTVLRDGKLVRTTPAADETEESLIQAMLGRSLGAAFPTVPAVAADAPEALRVRGLTAPGVRDVSLHVKAGEIVGLAGLVGSGRTELARAIFGASPRGAGTVQLGDGRDAGRTPRANLRGGLAMIPESRKDEGLLFGRSVTENTSLATLHRFSRGGMVRRGPERSDARQILDQWAVKCDGYSSPVSSLSGGNQQKVLFARMLMCRPTVLIADEPTRGVDVGAKRAIYDLMVSLVEQGLGVLLISSELEEILGLAHRVLVMRGGRVVSELRGDDVSESAILAAAFAEVPREDRAA